MEKREGLLSKEEMANLTEEERLFAEEQFRLIYACKFCFTQNRWPSYQQNWSITKGFKRILK